MNRPRDPHPEPTAPRPDPDVPAPAGDDPRLDVATVRAAISGGAAGLQGRDYWRSLEELAGTEEFRRMLEREFPEQAMEFDDPVGRRRFLQLMGASLAFAGLTACSRPFGEKIVPYVKQPEDLVPGKTIYYATAVRTAGSTSPVLVASTMGRPIKIEGNPEHPASEGGTDVHTQAAILNLYDPDRSKTVTNLGVIRPWSDLVGVVQEAAQAQRAHGGAGIRILTGAVTSPTLAAQIADLLREFPEARWHAYEPTADLNAREGARLAFGEVVEVLPDFFAADVVVSFQADFLGGGPGRLKAVRSFARRRKASAPAEHGAAPEGPGMNRLYVLESSPSLTGAKADHRYPVRVADLEGVVRAVAAAVGVPGVPAAPAATGIPADYLAAMVRDLKAHAGRSLVLAGAALSPAAHALVHGINQALGNAGRTVSYVEPADAAVAARTIAELAGEMKAGKVELLLILGGNPAYSAPAELGFADLFPRVALVVHLGGYDDETSVRSHWHVPEAHDLESWSDARTPDGTVTIIQPLIEPLYGGKTAHELLATLTKHPVRPGSEVVKEFWSRQLAGPDFPRRWERILHDGMVPGTAFPARGVAWRPESAAAAPAPAGGEGLELVFHADYSVHDGRYVNNGWLQELPRPLTRLTWDNAVLLAPATAGRLGLANSDLVDLSSGDRTVQGPVWILPGQAPGSISVQLGYGRTRTGRVGAGTGFDVYPLRTAAAPWRLDGVVLRKAGGRHRLASTQDHASMEGRPLVRAATLEHYREHPHFAHEMEEEPEREMSMYPEVKYEGYAWGMAIDLSACIGCGACTVACQSENNIPVVGREQVIRNREMHWIRIDRYFGGDLDNPSMHHQPVPCMQCENAPCEPVCPVAATVHSSEGLNDMVYNRCVGTRYCSNNCPYKVRRFNFLHYADFETPSLKLLRNPNVTVRTRGVMEKCTYCVQRINVARNEAGVANRPIQDGEVRTACQQACPAEAIVFGNQNDPASRVARAKQEPRNYSLLGGLNTRPRTTYLAALRNPNPEIEAGKA